MEENGGLVQQVSGSCLLLSYFEQKQGTNTNINQEIVREAPKVSADSFAYQQLVHESGNEKIAIKALQNLKML